MRPEIVAPDPAEEIDVRRDGKPVFTRCLPVAWWAARTVVEDGEQGPRNRLLGMQERQSNALAGLATRMRLTNQSRYTAVSAAVQAKGGSGVKLWEIPGAPEGSAPWED